MSIQAAQSWGQVRCHADMPELRSPSGRISERRYQESRSRLQPSRDLARIRVRPAVAGSFARSDSPLPGIRRDRGLQLSEAALFDRVHDGLGLVCIYFSMYGASGPFGPAITTA